MAEQYEVPSYSPSYDHVMVDIETMSLHRHKALILSVGLVEFDPNDDERLHYNETRLFVPLIVPQILLGRRVDVSTQSFWSAQTQAARDHWQYASEHHALDETIAGVRRFCDKRSVWANGTQFDLSNLEGLAEDLGDTKELWHYQSPRDMRTFVQTTTARRVICGADALDVPGVPHEPIYDCISQAWRVWANWQAPVSM